jgi:hypothetical protein
MHDELKKDNERQVIAFRTVAARMTSEEVVLKFERTLERLLRSKLKKPKKIEIAPAHD